MKMKRILGAALCAAMLLVSTSCSPLLRFVFSSGKDSASLDEYVISDDFGYSDDLTSSYDAASSDAQTVKEYGNETVGWMTLDDTFFQWYTPGNTDTCVQYAQSPTEIVTMDVFDCTAIKEQTGVDFDAYTAASSRLYQLQQASQTENIEKLTGSREGLGNYAAYQVYCYYPDDDQYLVMWYMDSPDQTKVYYVAAEFRSTEMSFFNYAQTYRMP